MATSMPWSKILSAIVSLKAAQFLANWKDRHFVCNMHMVVLFCNGGNKAAISFFSFKPWDFCPAQFSRDSTNRYQSLDSAGCAGTLIVMQSGILPWKTLLCWENKVILEIPQKLKCYCKICASGLLHSVWGGSFEKNPYKFLNIRTNTSGHRYAYCYHICRYWGRGSNRSQVSKNQN